jgi:hypothetical protein
MVKASKRDRKTVIRVIKRADKVRKRNFKQHNMQVKLMSVHGNQCYEAEGRDVTIVYKTLIMVWNVMNDPEMKFFKGN